MEIKYIVGIDFGHGEIAAWYIPIDEATSEEKAGGSLKIVPANHPGERKKRSVIYKDKNGKFIDGGPGQVFVGFKDKIKNLNRDEDRKEAYRNFIKEIYLCIINNNKQLIDHPNGDTNFSLYIACPTKWDNQDKEKYLLFFEEALSEFNRHIEWVINESDAAYFTHRDDQKVVLVIDYGSSTVDYTLICNGKKVSDDNWSNAQLGASAIEKSMLEAFRRDPNSNFQELLQKNEKLLLETGNEHFDVLSQLELEFRIVKEEGFTSYKENARKPHDYKLVFSFADVTCDSRFDDIEFRHRGFFYNDNGVCTAYIEAVETDFKELKNKINNVLGGRAIDKIILSGGACIMGWVTKSVERVFELPPQNRAKEDRGIVDDPNPEYVVAHGIALYAKAQRLALNQLFNELEKLDYVSMYKSADSEAIQKATIEMLPYVLDKFSGYMNHSGDAIRKMLGEFFYGLNSENNNYCHILQECMNNLLSKKIANAIDNAIKTVFACSVDTSDIRIEIPIDVMDWEYDTFVNPNNIGYKTITTVIKNSLNVFYFTWECPRDYDERQQIRNACLSQFSTLDPFGAISYKDEDIQRISNKICSETMKAAKEVFHKKELFQTTFKP